MFLSRPELEQLTGKKYAPAQKRVLKARKIAFTEDAAGRPVVLKASIERRLLGKASTSEPDRQPDFSVFPAVG